MHSLIGPNDQSHESEVARETRQPMCKCKWCSPIFSHTEIMKQPLVSLGLWLPALLLSLGSSSPSFHPSLPSLSISLQSYERREEYKREDEQESPLSWGPLPAAAAAEAIHPNAGGQREAREGGRCFGIQPWCEVCGWAWPEEKKGQAPWLLCGTAARLWSRRSLLQCHHPVQGFWLSEILGCKTC